MEELGPFSPASRVTRSRQSARAAYDRLSGWYDWLAGSEEAFNRQALAMLDAKPGERVLELGFGTGHALATLAGRGCRVAGVDLSYGMARAARKRLQVKGLRQDVLLSLGDGVQLPFAAGGFDAAFAAFTLELFDSPEIPAVLAEMARVLRENGRLGIVAMSLPERPGAMVRLYEWFHRRLPAYADCRPIPVENWVRQNGFVVQQVQSKSMWGLPVKMLVALNNKG